ncbi:MAG: tRNA (N(6)-L-threonylcarbamoyladenosine(37)-C(2))-methylthiotransferase MtaB [Hyphomicrobiaceae bacterium]
MRAHAAAAGLHDVIVVNTCAVTGEAVRQARQTLRKLAREHPDRRLIATGCAVQIDPDGFAAMPEVAHVIGNAEKTDPRTFSALATADLARIAVNDIMSVRETAAHLITGFGGRARAYVEVQNGCDHRCTFCVIPFGRGPSRSVPMGDVVAQVRTLVDAGYQEVVLTGVDITSFGADLPGRPKLGRLVDHILREVPDLARLRLSSIDQVEVDEHLMRAIAEQPRLMPHLHLSLQSGDDLILKRMKRRHSRIDAIRFCEAARRLRPEITFGADLIAGFPTETEAMFANTLDIVDACDLSYLHVFPFSPRAGTPAARMPQLSKGVIKERAAQLRAKGAVAKARLHQRMLGTTVRAVLERSDLARAENFTEIMILRDSMNGEQGDQAPNLGACVDIEVLATRAGQLYGRVAVDAADARADR